MISPSIDLGQLIVALLLSILTLLGWFIKKEITNFGKRIDRHDEILFNLTGTVQRLIGYYEASKNHLVGEFAHTDQTTSPRPPSKR